MTAGERLRVLAGVGGTAGALLLLIGSGATAGAALVDYSGLPTATAAVHLMTDVTTEVEVTGGSGYPVYGKYKRPEGISEFLDVAMSEIYEAGTDKDIHKATREQFAKVVKPYAKGKSKIPEVDNVNWKALEADAERVEQLLALWQMHLDDEEVIIMAYLEYHYN